MITNRMKISAGNKVATTVCSDKVANEIAIQNR